MTILEALQRGAGLLKSAGIEDPRFNADLLLGFVCGLRRDQLYLEREREISEERCAEYFALVERRRRREPLQYILGRQEFMGLPIAVDPRVLIPRPETELLVEKLFEVNLLQDRLQRAWSPALLPAAEMAGAAPRPGGCGTLAAEAESGRPRVVDLCTGSGAVAIAVAHYWPEAEVVGTDISAAALAVAAANARRLGASIEWRQGDLLEPIRSELWDWIVANPPYVAASEYLECSPEVRHEPPEALLGGLDGLDFYRRLAQDAPRLLRPGGGMLLEIGAQQGLAVADLFMAQGLAACVFADFAGHDRVVLVR